MAENDIYNSERRYLNFKNNIDEFKRKPINKNGKVAERKYYCKNPSNLIYFKKLFRYFETIDISFVRRIRLLSTLKIISYVTSKDLKNINRTDIDDIMIYVNKIYSPKSRAGFIRNIRYIWKQLFPEKDKKGRIDETITPYIVRHLSGRVDKSRQKRKKDRLTMAEYEKLVKYFERDKRIQLFITLSFESLGRPQELLYLKLGDVNVFDNYAKVLISEKGKEGIGMLQCIDSYPYLVKWLEEYPLKKNDNNFLFINIGNTNFGKQLKLQSIRKQLKTACKKLRINKPITPYSFKRNGITFRRLRGDSDVEIQHTARWSSTKQLQIYDKSDQEDVFKIQLAKRGLIDDDKYKQHFPATKICNFCGSKNGFSKEFCSNCKRTLDREKIQKQLQQEKPKELENLFKMIQNLQKDIEVLKSK